MQANYQQAHPEYSLRPARQYGFTLLELRVVVVIVAILFTYTTLAIRSDSYEDIIRKEAQRLERLIELSLEEAILRGEEYALEIYLDGYRFLRFYENQWQPLTDDRILREHQLPHDMELEISVEDTEIVIELASENRSDFDLEFDEESDEEAEDEKDKPQPQIFLLSSGEITPAFDIRFYILGVETSYFVKGQFDGTLTTEISDI